MADLNELLQTPLHALHLELGARMVHFAGYAMPVQYPAGLMAEHHHTRNAAGLFDVSHMGQLRLSGPEAATAFESLMPVDVIGLGLNRQRYGLLLNDEGGIIDDLMFVNRGSDLFVIVNGACKHGDLTHIQARIGGRCTVTPQFDRGLLALQGPQAVRALQRLLPGAESLVFMTGRAFEWEGAGLYVTRSGYTGEDGFEIYFKADAAAASKLFLDLAGKGEKYDALPAGLGARDTLRLEAKMALYGNDIDDSHTVLEADLGWILKLKKDEPFLGQEALARQKQEGIRRKLVGFELLDKGIARHGYPLVVDGRPFGTVTSGTFAPFLKKPIGLAYLPAEHCAVGDEFQITIRERTVSARVVETPFYKRIK